MSQTTSMNIFYAAIASAWCNEKACAFKTKAALATHLFSRQYMAIALSWHDTDLRLGLRTTDRTTVQEGRPACAAVTAASKLNF